MGTVMGIVSETSKTLQQQRKRRLSFNHVRNQKVCWITFALTICVCVHSLDAFVPQKHTHSRHVRTGRTRPALNEASRSMGLPISFPNLIGINKSRATESVSRNPRVVLRRPTKQETTGLPNSPDSVFFPFFPSTLDDWFEIEFIRINSGLSHLIRHEEENIFRLINRSRFGESISQCHTGSSH